jgi:hypothetical protein
MHNFNLSVASHDFAIVSIRNQKKQKKCVDAWKDISPAKQQTTATPSDGIIR